MAGELAGLANHDLGRWSPGSLARCHLRWTAALTAQLVEETLKALGMVLIYLIAHSEPCRVLQ